MDIEARLRRWALFGGRWRTAGQARGRVLELGIGTGSNLPYYRQAEDLVGIDPRPDALSLARALHRDGAQGDAGGPPGEAEDGGPRRHGGEPIPLGLVAARGEALPFADGTFDTIVTALVFCSVGDPLQALVEARRVLRPGGELRCVEHVLPARGPLRLLVRLLVPLYDRISHECRLDRDTLATLQAAGFSLRDLRPHAHGLVVEFSAGMGATREA